MQQVLSACGRLPIAFLNASVTAQPTSNQHAVGVVRRALSVHELAARTARTLVPLAGTQDGAPGTDGDGVPGADGVLAGTMGDPIEGTVQRSASLYAWLKKLADPQLDRGLALFKALLQG